MATTLVHCDGPLRSFEKTSLNPGLRSNSTPAELGVPFEPISMPSGPGVLDGFLVRASAGCPKTAAVLLFHGRGETIADWIRAQRTLSEGCVSSLAFDYSGHGRSTSTGTVDHLNADAVVAYSAFLRYFPNTERRCLLGHSMGSGPLLYVATHTALAPDCVILASPFPSLRALAILGGLPKWAGFMMPDVWDNVGAVTGLRAPLLWLHSRSDATIPMELGRQVYDAKVGSKSAVVLNGFGHNAIYASTPAEFWAPIVAFIMG